MYEKMKAKRQNGVTLIALVITVIILLILAGVTIAMLTGDNGVLTKSKRAKEESLKNGYKEQIEVSVLNSRMASEDHVTINNVELRKELAKIQGATAVVKKGDTVITVPTDDNEGNAGENELPWTVEVGGFTFEINGGGKVDINDGVSEETSSNNEENGPQSSDTQGKIMVDEEEYANLKTTVSNLSTRLTQLENNQQNPTTINQNINMNNWTLLKSTTSAATTYTLPNNDKFSNYTMIALVTKQNSNGRYINPCIVPLNIFQQYEISSETGGGTRRSIAKYISDTQFTLESVDKTNPALLYGIK